MTTAKYFRGIGPLWNINKLRKELEAALGQAVTCNTSPDGTTLEIEYTVPGAANIIDQVVAAHIAEVGYTIKAGNTNALFTNYGNFFYGTGSIEDGDASGIWGGYPAIEYPAGSGTFWTLIQLNAGTITWASNSQTGAQTSGAGAVTQGPDGISITGGLAGIHGIKWYTDTTPYLLSEIYAGANGSTPNRNGVLSLFAYAETGGTGHGTVQIESDDGNGDTAVIQVLSDYTAANSPFKYFGKGGQTGSFHYGDYAGYKIFTNATTQQTLYSRVVKANSLGTFGHIHCTGAVLLRTTSPNNRNMVITFDFGGTTIFSWTTSGTTATSGREVMVSFDFTLTNAGVTNSQFGSIRGTEHSGAAPGTDPTAATIATFARASVASAEDTTADQTFSLFATPNNNANTLELLSFVMSGPYFASA